MDGAGDLAVRDGEEFGWEGEGAEGVREVAHAVYCR